MSTHKVVIQFDGDYYNQRLYKRQFFFFWKLIDFSASLFAVTDLVLRWQNEYNIPDKRVIIYQH